MARPTSGPRRTESVSAYKRATRIVGAVSVLILVGTIAWDFASDGFWAEHTLFTGLVASVIVVAVTAAVLNEALERRQRERWAIVAQFALFELVQSARLVWSTLLELAGLVPEEEVGDAALQAGTEIVRDTPRLSAAMDDVLSDETRREDLHRAFATLLAHGQDVLGRWSDVMVNSGTYAEVIDRHVELYSRLYWWGSVLDEHEPLEEHLARPKLARVSPASQTSGAIEEEWLRDNVIAIVELAESLDRDSLELAMRIVPLDWWVTQLPDRPSAAGDPPHDASLYGERPTLDL
jgi:hypothetical protein